jgi:hypothetical protein
MTVVAGKLREDRGRATKNKKKGRGVWKGEKEDEDEDSETGRCHLLQWSGSSIGG